MDDFELFPTLDPSFVGRERELAWLDHRIFERRHSFAPIIVTGYGGIGKTALVRQWLASRRISSTPLWANLYEHKEPCEVTDLLVKRIHESRTRSPYIVVLDGSESLDDEHHEKVVSQIVNHKAVDALIFTTRTYPTLRRAEILALDTLPVADAEALLKASLGDLDVDTAEALKTVQGYPLAVSILASLLKSGNVDSLQELLGGQIYDISKTIAIPSTDIVTEVAPKIITANEALVENLRRQPEDIYSLTPRKFEELLAELLADMGWDVELTQQTRDGGKDILAYLNTDLGRLLCLVEAKHYRKDRKIGVDLVRTLYGTLCDERANSAMLITSSSFTSGAKEFQQRHEYQLGLRDYGDIVNWIMKYGCGPESGITKA